MIFYYYNSAYDHIFVKTPIYRPLYSYRAWVYIGFVNGGGGGFGIVWCEYLWIATFPCGGGGGPPPRKFRNMKCSRSDSRHILGLLRVTLCSEPNIFLYN